MRLPFSAFSQLDRREMRKRIVRAVCKDNVAPSFLHAVLLCVVAVERAYAPKDQAPVLLARPG
eukprot:4268500-Lingulodinium_polyedra.AAC.1